MASPVGGMSGAVAAECESARALALTFDDLPAQRGERLSNERLEALTDGILAALERAEAPAIGFVNMGKLYAGESLLDERRAVLLRWAEAGLELGNHTYSHPDLHRVPLSDFKQDVLRGEELLRELAESHHGSLRYFRHPFLHTGRELELRHDFEGFLADHGYRVAPVTVDNSEWIFARAMDEALDRNDDELANRLEQAYVGYMVDMVDYYEGQSCTLFGRLIPQILLLHANALNGRALGTLLARLAELGYEFATLDQALEDGAYSSPDTYTGPAGITWLHRWALTRDVDRSMFAGEPTTPVWVQELAGISE
jgi:peptidoglycan/xylan/chitin deacetylase (PgdA/CDA1 family)